MRIGIRTKQVAGVMAIVGLASIVLGAWYLASLTESGSRARDRARDMLCERHLPAHVHRVQRDPAILWRRSGKTAGSASILEASTCSAKTWSMRRSAIVDNRVLVDIDPTRIEHAARAGDAGRRSRRSDRRPGPIARFRAICTTPGQVRDRDAAPRGSASSARSGSRVDTGCCGTNCSKQSEDAAHHGAAAVLIASIVVAMLSGAARAAAHSCHPQRTGAARPRRAQR